MACRVLYIDIRGLGKKNQEQRDEIEQKKKKARTLYNQATP